MCDFSGAASGTRMTSIRNCAVFGFSAIVPELQPGNSSAGLTEADPET
jgi:hypothetical protein